MRMLSTATLVALVCMVQIACAGAEIQPAEEAASPAGNPQRGQALFESEMGCNICHGMDASGAIGPDIRQTSIEKVYHAMQNFPDMMNWQYNYPELFEEQGLLDIVAYLQTLEKDPVE